MSALIERIQNFLRLEASAGIILMLAALLALLVSNSVLQGPYANLLNTLIHVQAGDFIIAKPLILWINDGLMAIFFFLVGLEVKREVLEGELSSFDKAALPIFGAIGGMAVPAAIFVAINWNSPETINGWAIPAATDIAFALGLLMLMGARAPVSLKILLLAIAIMDDLGAIVIIALFYTADLSVSMLLAAVAGTIALFMLNRFRVNSIAPYAIVGTIIWVCVLKSGVHATMAGVVTALMIPMAKVKGEEKSLLHRTEHGLHPWVAYMILPLFAFANAGMSFAGLSWSDFTHPLPLGILLGLVIGKPLGVTLMSFIAVRTGLAKLPADLNWSHIVGLACLTGVGFTMSLFIGGLAFGDPESANLVRLGVIAGSTISALLGVVLISAASPRTAGHTRPTELSIAK